MSSSGSQPRRGDSIELGRIAPAGGFMAAVDDLKAAIRAVRRSTADLERLHRDSLANVSAAQAARASEQAAQLGADTDAQLQRARARIRQLRAETSRLPATSADRRLRSNQERALAGELMQAAGEYRALQLRVQGAHVDKFARQYQIVRPGATQREIDAALAESQGGAVFAQEIVSANRAEAQQSLRAVRARHADIKQIEKSVEQLVALMEEMQFMIDAQQETLNAVDVHVDNAAANMAAGSTEVSKAITHRMSARKRAWILCTLLIILLAIAGVLIYFYAIKPLLDQQQASKPTPTNKA